MSSIVYKDQSATELRLHIVADKVDFRQFTPLAVARLERPRLQLHAGIIGASHIVQISSANQHLSEVLACTALPKDISTRCSRWVSDLTEPLDFRPSPAMHYAFEVQHLDSREGRPAFQALVENIARTSQASIQSSSIGLDYSFPETPRGTAPQTLVWAMINNASQHVSIKTAHSYPNEDAIVFSHSHVTFGP